MVYTSENYRKNSRPNTTERPSMKKENKQTLTSNTDVRPRYLVHTNVQEGLDRRYLSVNRISGSDFSIVPYPLITWLILTAIQKR